MPPQGQNYPYPNQAPGIPDEVKFTLDDDFGLEQPGYLDYVDQGIADAEQYANNPENYSAQPVEQYEYEVPLSVQEAADRALRKKVEGINTIYANGANIIAMRDYLENNPNSNFSGANLPHKSVSTYNSLPNIGYPQSGGSR